MLCISGLRTFNVGEIISQRETVQSIVYIIIKHYQSGVSSVKIGIYGGLSDIRGLVITVCDVLAWL